MRREEGGGFRMNFLLKINKKRKKKKKKNNEMGMVFRTLDIRLVVQLLSHVQFFATLWMAAHQATLFFTIFRS